jgi:hypothetical protein
MLSKSRLMFLLGALLIAGLFVFLRERRDHGAPLSHLKPSQVDFTQSNQLQTETATTPVEKAASSVDKQNANYIPKLPEKDQIRWATLEEILKSKNDNDPRMDKDLKVMSPEFHQALFEKYEAIQPEKRNERGTIAFLIARDLKSPEDAEFLKKIYEESPCTSLADCKSVGSEDPHYAGMNQTTLNYPQLISLYQIDARLSANKELLADANTKDAIAAALRQAAGFPVPAVSQKAEELIQKWRL